MALTEGAGDFDRGTSRARKGKVRARSRAACLPRFQVELLEARVLLFGGQFPAPIQLVSLGALSPQAIVSHSAAVTPFFGHGALVFPSLGQQAGDDGTTLLAPVHLAISAVPEGTSTAFGMGGRSPVDLSGPIALSDIAYQASNPSAGASPYLVTLHSHGAPIGGGEENVGVRALDSGGPSWSVSYAEQNGIGPSAVGMFISSPPSISEGTSGPAYPGGYRAIEGTLDAAHPSFTAEFLVGSSSESYSVVVHPTGGPGVGAVVGVLRWMSADGDLVAEATPDMGAGGPGPQGFIVSLRGAPVGGRLSVQIVPSDSPAPSEAGTTAVAAPASDWSVPFVLYVQRQDEQAPVGPIEPPAQGSVAAGTLAFSTSVQAVVPSSSDSPVNSATTPVSDSALSSQDAPPPAIAVADQSAADSLDGFNLRVPTGPFASRSAGPLGPILASVGGDPTPEVDRNERALFQEIERRDASDDIDRNSLGDVATLGEPGGTEADEHGGRVVSVSGAGGLPFKVTGFATKRRTDLSALLASIPTLASSEVPQDEPAETAHWIDRGQVAVIAEATTPEGEHGYSDFIKAACGLALGLGMSSRALFPDLLASVGNRVPTWLRNRRARARNRTPGS